jgi:hypothetical protein
MKIGVYAIATRLVKTETPEFVQKYLQFHWYLSERDAKGLVQWAKGPDAKYSPAKKVKR